MNNQRPYFTFYCDAYEKVMLDLGRVARDVLVALAQHTDPRGLCWPGVGRLAALVHVADDSVRDALYDLEQAGHIRTHWRYSGVRRTWERESFQVSPDVIPIRDEFMPEALALWKRDFRNDNVSNEIKESQPTIVTNSIGTNEVTNASKPTPVEPPPPPPTPVKQVPLEKGVAADYTNRTNGENAKMQKKQNGKSAIAAGTPAPPGATNPVGQRRQAQSPPVPRHPPLPPNFNPNVPLSDAALEAFANDLPILLAQSGNRRILTLANARRYVARYPESVIRTAIELAKNDTRTKTLVGKMDWLLRSGVNSETDSKKLDDLNRYTSGEYAAFIRS